MSSSRAVRKYIPFILVIMLIALASITGRSMWIDEVCRVSAASVGDLKGAIDFGLECAQPGYTFLMYLWARLFSGIPTEFAFRCSNLIFAFIAAVFASRIVEKKKWPAWIVLLFFIHPLFTYYMNEATPYILIYALALAFVERVFLSDNFSTTRNIIAINIIFLLGVSVHFLFGFLVFEYLIKCFITIRKDKKLVIKHAAVMIAFGVLYVPLLWLYLTHLDGASTGFGIKNVLYVIYAFAGMGGLGLSRSDLHAGSFRNITGIQIVMLLLMVAVIVGIFIACISKKREFLKKNRELAIGMAAVVLILMIIAVPVGFGIWERHYIMILPAFMILMIEMFLEMSKDRRNRILIAAYCLLLLFSCANHRLNPYYSTDDLRGVRDYAAEQYANNEQLTIIADVNSEYYNTAATMTRDDQKFYNSLKRPMEDIIRRFDMDRAEGKTILILSEHYTSKPVYKSYDDNDEFVVDNSIKGFKVIMPANQMEVE